MGSVFRHHGTFGFSHVLQCDVRARRFKTEQELAHRGGLRQGGGTHKSCYGKKAYHAISHPGFSF
jgi:hypothetical protein